MTTEAPGLREAKKLATRDALHAAAVRLMSESGFTATTTAQIADEAGVSPRTFFGYFPSKEAVLYAPFEDIVEAFAAGLRERPDGVDTLAFLEEWIPRIGMHRWPEGGVSPLLLRTLAEDAPSVALYGLRFMDRMALLLADALRSEQGLDESDPLPDITAAALVAALGASLSIGHADAAANATVNLADAERPVATALAFVRGGLRAAQQER